MSWYRQMSPTERRTFIAAFGGWALDAFDFMVFTFVIATLGALFHIDKGQAGMLATVTLLFSASAAGWPAFSRIVSGAGACCKPLSLVLLRDVRTCGCGRAARPTGHRYEGPCAGRADPFDHQRGGRPTAHPEKQRANGVQRATSLLSKLRHTLAKRAGEYDFSHEVKEAMDTCLACKSCAGQCPVKVDVPAFRARFLALYHPRYLRPARDWLMALLEQALPWLARAPRLVNTVQASALAQFLLRHIGLVKVPPLSGIDLVSAAGRAGFEVATPESVATATAQGQQVVVQDAFTTHYGSVQAIGFSAY